jgi:hypothetical protein
MSKTDDYIIDMANETGKDVDDLTIKDYNKGIKRKHNFKRDKKIRRDKVKED